MGGEAPVTPVSSPDSSSLDLSYKPCDNMDHNITCSHLRDHLLAFVLGLSSLGVRRNLLEGLFFGKWCYLPLEGLQLGNG